MTDQIEPGEATVPTGVAVVDPAAERRRRRRLYLLGGLVGLLAVVFSLTTYYLVTRKPLPDIIPPITVETPHYLFSIYGVDKPAGVAVDPAGGLIYVTEVGGEHLVKTFDSSGKMLNDASPPQSQAGDRVPVYAARDPLTGEIYTTDRIARTVDIYTPTGDYARTFSPPASVDPDTWQPLGVAFDDQGLLYVSDVGSVAHRILAFDRTGSLLRTLDDGGGLLYPNGIAPRAAAVLVADGNNGRVVLLRADGSGTALIAQGASQGSLGLPRGIAFGDNDRLFVVDAIAHSINVYRLPAGTEQPEYLGVFGAEGRGDGQFEYPNGIALDGRGRLYIADRENDRVQVWSY
jgi:DNA-binding beta-propeller fold protein YncE